MSESETNITGDVHGDANTGNIGQVGDRTVNTGGGPYYEHLTLVQKQTGDIPDLAKVTTDYLTWLVDRNRYLDPRGTYQTQRQVMLELKEVYVSLRAERDDTTNDVDRALLESEWQEIEHRLKAEGLLAEEIEDRREQLLRRYTRQLAHQQHEEAAILKLEDAVARHPLVVILGDPGSGKTTLVRFLALQAAQQIRHPSRQPAPAAPPFPILLRIADYAEEDRWKDNSLTDFLPDAYARQDCPSHGLADLLHTRLEEGGCLVLLDGLDEIVDADHRRRIVQRIEDFVRRHRRGGNQGENRFVVTSRVAGYRTAPLGLNFVHFTVQEMDDAQIRTFLRKWCSAVEDAGAPQSPEGERQRLADREVEGIMRAIESTPGVRRLAANPLMLRTLALIHRTGAQLPQRRVELYKLAAETLECTWRTAQGISETHLSALLQDRELPGLLGVLAYWTHLNKPSGVLTQREVEQVLGEEWSRLRRLAWDPDDPNPEILTEIRKFLDAVREHTGLFVERAPRRYGFMHLTFEEYYAARHLVARQRRAPTLIRQHLHDPRWEEPILLALGFVGLDYPEDAADLVETAILAASPEAKELAFTPSKYEELLGRDYLFALRCLGDRIPVHTKTLANLMARLAAELTQQSSLSHFSRYRDVIWRRLPQLQGGPSGAALSSNLVSALSAKHSYVRRSAAKGLARLRQSSPEVISALIQALSDADTDVRRNAIEGLGRLGQSSPGVIAAFVQATSDADAKVRKLAVEGLVRLEQSSPGVVAVLIQSLSDANPDVHRQATEGLVRLGQGNLVVVAALIKAFSDTDIELCKHIAWCLVRMGERSPEAVAVFVQALSNKNVEMRRLAAETLGDLKQSSPEVVASLAQALSDADTEVYMSAVCSLMRLGQRGPKVAKALIQALSDVDVYVRSYAAESLGSLGQSGPKVVNALIQALSDVDADVRSNAAKSLGSLGQSRPKVVNVLVQALFDADAGVRRLAAEGLALLNPTSPKGVVTLIQALSSENTDMRMVAAAGLGDLGQSSPTVVAALIQAFSDTNSSVRQYAAWSLVDLGRSNPTVITTLVQALSNVDSRIRTYTAWSIGRLGQSSPEVINALIQTLSDSDVDVRMNTAWSMGQIGHNSPEAVAALVYALVDEDEYVRRNAVKALGNLGQNSQQVVVALVQALSDEDINVCRAAAESLAHLRPSTPESISALIQALSNTDLYIRRDAIEGFVRLEQSSSEVVAALIQALFDVDQYVRREAAAGLGCLGQNSPEVVAALVQALSDVDADVRRYAAESLECLEQNSVEAVAALVHALSAADEGIRRSAAEGLGRLGQNSPEVIAALVHALSDVDGSVRRDAATSLVQIARRPQSTTVETEALLLNAIQDPAFETANGHARTGQDYAYDALWQIVTGEFDNV